MAIDEELTPLESEVEAFRRNFSRFFNPDFQTALTRWIAKARDFKPFSVSVGTTAVQVLDRRNTRTECWLFNSGNATIFIGDSSKVTTGPVGDPNAGFPLIQSTGMTIDRVTAPIWAISGSAGMDLRVAELAENSV